jgi:regulator of protease activity HflC (stomatin/prohibitin superfamily)
MYPGGLIGFLFSQGIFYIVVLIVLALFVLQNTVRVLREYERAVIFRLGKLARAFLNPGGTGNGPGLVVLLPIIDRMVKVSLRTVTMDVPAQDIITKDNVSVKVSAVIYFRVLDAEKAVVQVEDFLFATSQIAQTTLRSVLGQSEMDELLMERDRINQRLQQIIDAHTEPWGVKVSVVEVKQIDLPPEMQRAMAKQAEAEREKRAKIIHAEGELMASEKLAEAGRILAVEPVTVQLRYLQTLTEIGTEKNSTIVFPIPIDILKTFLQGDAKPAPNP